MKLRRVLGLLAVAAVLVFTGLPERPMPRFEEVRGRWSPSDVRLVDRNGEVLHESRVDASVRRLAWTPLDEVSPALVRAVIESEDRRFHAHSGIDWRAVAAAAWQSFDGGARRGASTIPMQLAALVDPSLRRDASGRSPIDKLAQMQAAAALDAAWTKDQVLEAYLNLVGFRGELEGVRAAAETVFGKAPHGLTVEESAALAASIRSPGAPIDRLLWRSRELAARLGDGDEARIETAVNRLAGAASQRGSRRAMAPHAARLLLQAEARTDAGHSGGAGSTPTVAPASAPRLLPRNGDVRTSLDARIQAVAATSLERHVREIRDRSASDGAVLVVDNDRGEVLAYVGSTAGLSNAREVDGVRAPRQAGSTLKPFLYALAIDQGLVTAATLLEDTPLEVAVDERVYRPENYDHRFRGLVPVRTALAASLNIPAVRTLLLVGEDAFADKLRALRLGGVSERGDWYGPSLALGSVDVTLWDLVGAYRALATGGSWGPLRFDAAGNRPAGDRVFDASSAWIVGDMLADRGSRTATFHRDGPLSTRYWTAVKTGTSKDMRDNWCVGWSSRFTVGVWIGNFSGEPMHDVSGTTGAAPIWREVMDALHESAASPPPERPPGVVLAVLQTGSEPGPASTIAEFFRSGTEPMSETDADARVAADLDRRARITSPATGTRIAIDPDVPPARQRVALAARFGSPEIQWVLDGRAIGNAEETLLWPPVPGRHRLDLVDREGRLLDSVRFEVRGARAG